MVFGDWIAASRSLLAIFVVILRKLTNRFEVYVNWRLRTIFAST